MYNCARGSSAADAGASISRTPRLPGIGGEAGAEAPTAAANDPMIARAIEPTVMSPAAKCHGCVARCCLRDVVKAQATEWVIVAVYVPAAIPPGMSTVIVGLHVAELSPVIALAVTAGETPVRSGGSLAVYTAVPTFVMVPAA